MTIQLIDRAAEKRAARELLRTAQVSCLGMTSAYLLLLLVLDMVSVFCDTTGPISTFVIILVDLISLVLGAGFTMYCMAVRRGERAEYLTLFDGFSFVGKLIGVQLLTALFVVLWGMLFIIPGIIAAYRYRFALFNLYDDPDISILEALEMSRRQTAGYKGQLFFLDLSYIGWLLLAYLPSSVHDAILTQQSVSAFLTGGPAAISAVTSVSMLPEWGWTLVGGLWLLVVAQFFLPHRRCVELAYFDIAKQTSGVGAGASTRRRGPDDLGGF